MAAWQKPLTFPELFGEMEPLFLIQSLVSDVLEAGRNQLRSPSLTLTRQIVRPYLILPSG